MTSDINSPWVAPAIFVPAGLLLLGLIVVAKKSSDSNAINTVKTFPPVGNSGYGTRIETDDEWHELLSSDEVPEDVQLEHPDSDAFVQHHDDYYPLSSFQRGGVEGWDGSIPWGWSAGLLVKLDGEGQYKLGTWMLVSA